MSALIDLKGKRFGRLVVVERATNIASRETRWLCRCDCTTEITVQAGNLKSGNTCSCGCLKRDVFTTHGESHTPEHRAYWSMLDRTCNPRHHAWKNYGGRNIRTCWAWLSIDGYQLFLANVGRRPSRQHSLDRWPNNDGNYEPGNVRWATKSEQNKNQRPRKSKVRDIDSWEIWKPAQAA